MRTTRKMLAAQRWDKANRRKNPKHRPWSTRTVRMGKSQRAKRVDSYGISLTRKD